VKSKFFWPVLGSIATVVTVADAVGKKKRRRRLKGPHWQRKFRR
jgi:hypothetical protein